MKAYLISGAIAVALAAAGLGIFFGVFQSTTAGPSNNSTPAGNVSVDDDPARGPECAPVTIIEFSDFQCPACRSYVDNTLPVILSTYGDRVRLVFRDMPVAQSHPKAEKAAEAAQCAFEQGKFWEYDDTLFQNQEAVSLTDLQSYATALGLDESAFNQCLDSGKYTEEVQKDFNDGLSYGVNAVPTFFINGRKVVVAQPFSTFQQVIEEELAKAGFPESR